MRLWSRLSMLVAALLLASGCVATPPVDPSAPLPPQRQALADFWFGVVQILCDDTMEGRGVDTAGIHRTADYLVEQFITLGLQPAFMDEHGRAQWRQAVTVTDPQGASWTTFNIAGLIPGHGPLASQTVVVGAHYDHLGYGPRHSRMHADPRWPEDASGLIHPGADDNASGVASLLTLARLAADHPPTGHGPQGRRTMLLVAFTAEEWGLYGSRHFVSHPDQLAVDPSQVGVMLNLDMVGRVDRNRLYVYWSERSPRWAGLLRRANEPVGLRLITDEPLPGISDEWPFMRRGVAVLLLTSGRHADYHTPADTPETLDVTQAIRVTLLVWNLLGELLTRDQIPWGAFSQGN